MDYIKNDAAKQHFDIYWQSVKANQYQLLEVIAEANKDLDIIKNPPNAASIQLFQTQNIMAKYQELRGLGDG